jgi:hypothetical protein
MNLKSNLYTGSHTLLTRWYKTNFILFMVCFEKQVQNDFSDYRWGLFEADETNPLGEALGGSGKMEEWKQLDEQN